MIKRWIFALIMLILCIWFGKLTLGNLWLAGGPPTSHAETYLKRADVFGVITVLFFLFFIVITILNIAKMTQQRR